MNIMNMQNRSGILEVTRRGTVFILSSPSGAGKTTLVKYLLSNDRDLRLSVSVTTRQPRKSEIDGRDYHFVDQELFQKMVDTNNFLEYAGVFGNYYGTPEKPVEQWLTAGLDVLFDVDWQGAQQLSQHIEHNIVSIFILPPTMKSLRDRLKKRGQDSDSCVAERMNKACNEICHWAEYDYIIINDDISASQESLLSILKAERIKRQTQIGLTDFVRALIQDVP